MKKITIVMIMFLIALFLLSCGPHKEEFIKVPTELVPSQYTEYTLEGCQYIVVGFGPQRWGSHKGNCSNTIHKNGKLL
jgi:hypothetical protein